MRVFTVAVAVGDWRDRNANSIGEHSNVTVIAASPDTQITYTVPAGRAAVIDNVMIRLEPLATMAQGAFVQGLIDFTASGGVGFTLENLALGFQQGPATFFIKPIASIQMFAGDRMRLRRLGGGSPPNTIFNMGFHGVEYDE